MSANGETRRVESAVCAGCGTLCDDVVLLVEGDRARAECGLCERGEAWLRALGPLQSRAWIGRDEATLDAALEKGRSLLRAARAPWLVIGPRLGLEATRAAVRVAELARASILIASEERFDPRAGLDGPDLSASRGEVSGSAELVILLRADPIRDLPRFMERHVFRRDGERDGEPRPCIILVDTPRALESHATKDRVDEVISLRPGDPERAALAWVRELAIGIEALFEEEAFEATELAASANAGADGETLSGGTAAKRLARSILAARHVHVYASPVAARDRALLEELRRLAAAVRARTRVTSSLLPGTAGSATAPVCLSWRFASPGPIVWLEALSALGDDPRYDRHDARAHWAPGLWSIEDLARDRLADLVLLAGIEDPGSLPIGGAAPRLGVGHRRDEDAQVWFEVPDLDPRVAMDVIREDGIALRMCGNDPHASADPAVQVFRALGDAFATQPSSTSGGERGAS